MRDALKGAKQAIFQLEIALEPCETRKSAQGSWQQAMRRLARHVRGAGIGYSGV